MNKKEGVSMKIQNILLVMPLIFVSMGALATEEPLVYREHSPSGHKSAHDSPKEPSRLPPSSHRPQVAVSVNADPNAEILARVQRYTGGGMAFSDALTKATKEVQESKESPEEKKLRSLGCVGWSDIPVITPHILQSVEAMYDAKNGPFILAPGLRIRYLSDKY